MSFNIQLVIRGSRSNTVQVVAFPSTSSLIHLLRGGASFELADDLPNDARMVVRDCVNSLMEWQDLLCNRHISRDLQDCFDADDARGYYLNEAVQGILQEFSKLRVVMVYSCSSAESPKQGCIQSLH